MATYKKQHYIPQFLLKRFSIERDNESIKEKSIYRLAKETGDIGKKGVKNCAYENYYYSFLNNDGTYNPILENLFSSFEGKASECLNRIDRNVDLYKRTKTNIELNDDDKETIVFFLFLSMVRVPAMYGQMIKKIKDHENKMSRAYGIEVSEERIKFNCIRLLSEITNPNKSKVYPALKKKHLSVLYCRKSQNQFIIGDCPVFFHNDHGPNGLRYIETEVYFPVSPTICLILQDNLPKITYLHIDQLDFIDQINKRIYSNSIEYVFSDNSHLLEELMK